MDSSQVVPRSTLDLAEDTQGRTPLAVAAECNHLEVLRFLLDAGANSDLKDHEAIRNRIFPPCSTGRRV